MNRSEISVSDIPGNRSVSLFLKKNLSLSNLVMLDERCVYGMLGGKKIFNPNNFDSTARIVLNNLNLVIDGRMWRPIEIEFYLLTDDHLDPWAEEIICAGHVNGEIFRVGEIVGLCFESDEKCLVIEFKTLFDSDIMEGVKSLNCSVVIGDAYNDDVFRGPRRNLFYSKLDQEEVFINKNYRYAVIPHLIKMKKYLKKI